MAHIADYMDNAASSVGLNNLIARELSVSPSPQSMHLESQPAAEKDNYIWRMHQPSESRRYNIFPSKEKSSVSGRQSPTTEATSNLQGGKDRHNIQRPRELSLNRRRKPSVIDLGTMTTVQENPMDSPTIPGRPPMHERSTSAPGSRWRQHTYGETLTTCLESPAMDRTVGRSATFPKDPVAPSRPDLRSRSGSDIPRQPLSPQSLAPLVIPTRTAHSPQRIRINSSPTELRSPTPPEVPPKSARLMEQSPYIKNSPFTPLSSASLLSTAPTSVSNTPITPADGRTSPKPWMMNGRSSPKSWMNLLPGRSSPKPFNNSAATLTQYNSNNSASSLAIPTPRRDSPTGHFRNQSETVAIHQQRAQGLSHSSSHRRGDSEPSAHVMDRGRPKKRAATSPIKGADSKKVSPTSEEQLAFEHLPQGVRPTQASSKLTTNEMEVLRRQALGQVERFEVLNSKDVESLSRELRALDERCLYLRKTHRSLRAGRRSLHERICSYLRSPRTAKFSHDAILKQEEALAELDSSIDDWVAKLDQAENRRTRVRQKLLEHVAAAVFMQPVGSSGVDANTPPRSPIKENSPVIEVEEIREKKSRVIVKEEEVSFKEEETVSAKRQTVESIKIYADSDVFALLADVEDEINRMGELPSTSENSYHQQESSTSPRSQPQRQSKPEELSIIKAQKTSPLPPKSPVPQSPFLLRPMAFTMPKPQGVRA